jgi:hypothetical protein
MKVRIVTEGSNVVGYQVVENESPAPGQFRAALTAGQGQKVHEVELADDFALVPNPEEIHKKLAAHFAKKATA